MICKLEKYCIFASVSRPRKLNLSSGVDFLCPFERFYPQGYKAVLNPMLATSYSGCSFLGRKLGGKTAFLILLTYKFHSTMTKEMKSASKVNNSSRICTFNGTKSVSTSLQEIINFYYPNPVELTLSEFKELLLIPAMELGAKKFIKSLKRKKQ